MAIKMTKALRDFWVRKLLSGRFIQGPGELRYKTKKGTAYCCLGVLAHACGLRKDSIAMLNGGNIKSIHDYAKYGGDQDGEYQAEYQNASEKLPELPTKIEDILIAMNDGIGQPYRSFKEIADYIKSIPMKDWQV